MGTQRLKGTNVSADTVFQLPNILNDRNITLFQAISIDITARGPYTDSQHRILHIRPVRIMRLNVRVDTFKCSMFECSLIFKCSKVRVFGCSFVRMFDDFQMFDCSMFECS